MKIPLSWLRDFVDVPNDPARVAAHLAACGFAVESIEGDVIDFEVTANRPDCLSAIGLAREAATAFDLPLTLAAPPSPSPSGPAPISVSLADDGCGRYALAVAEVTIAPSPAWMASRLLSAGVRPINNIVDITNYVMMEMGQPMHAFDASRLAGPAIVVRRAREKEPLTTLDGDARSLDQTMLVIADRDRAVAVAGVIGETSSEVSGSTTRVAFESAWFVPGTIRATSRKLGLKTEASARFERGADPSAPLTALHRALELLAQMGAGHLVGGITDVEARTREPHKVSLRKHRIAHLLGASVADSDVERILRHLGFGLAADATGWHVEIPSFRVDVSREVDLIEEVARHWGFDRVAPTFPALETMPRTTAPAIARGRLIRRLLTGAGLQEAVTITFIDQASAAPFATEAPAVTIKNPLSEKFAVLRPSLVAGLLESAVYNLNRQATDVRLFEVGSVFSADHGERSCVGWLMTGARGGHWSGDGGPIGFTDAKGIAELLATAFGVALTAAPADDAPHLQRGQRARLVTTDGREAGWVGRLASTPGTDAPIYAGEIALEAIGRAHDVARITPLPRFPSIVRDLSIFVDEPLPAADVRGTIRSNAPASLVDIREFDRYQGKGVPEGQVSLSLRLTFRDPERTLTDVEVQEAVDRIVQSLERAHRATLRGK